MVKPTVLLKDCPCIGYWDYSPGSSTVETTTPSTTTPTSGGGSSEDPKINTGVYLDIPGNKQWLRDYLKSGDYKPYVVYKYEGKETNHLMQFNSDGSRCTLDNCIAPRGSRVIGFKFVNEKVITLCLFRQRMNIYSPHRSMFLMK